MSGGPEYVEGECSRISGVSVRAVDAVAEESDGREESDVTSDPVSKAGESTAAAEPSALSCSARDSAPSAVSGNGTESSSITPSIAIFHFRNSRFKRSSSDLPGRERVDIGESPLVEEVVRLSRRSSELMLTLRLRLPGFSGEGKMSGMAVPEAAAVRVGERPGGVRGSRAAAGSRAGGVTGRSGTASPAAGSAYGGGAAGTGGARYRTELAIDLDCAGFEVETICSGVSGQRARFVAAER